MTNGDIPPPARSPQAKQERRSIPPSRARFGIRDIQIYRLCDTLTEPLIYFLLIATPWWFGTTQAHVIRLMNVIGYSLGFLWLVKSFICHIRGYQPPRWGRLAAPANVPTTDPLISGDSWVRSARLLRWLSRTLAALTIVVLAYCLVSALNARSTWLPYANIFEYHKYKAWLPHSYDRTLTWQTFWKNLALAGDFWAIHSWLIGLTSAEESAGRRLARGPAPTGKRESALLPGRLRRLLWVLCINGGLLGLEGIAQRLSGTTRLLWLVQPRVNKEALSQFGPYAYRANAAQYFNLIWPVCLGFWWTLHRTRGFKHWSHHLLLLSGVLMAACPVVATTRGGAIVACALIVLSAMFLALSPVFFSSRRWFSPMVGLLTFVVLCGFFVGSTTLAFHLGWRDLRWRMLEIEKGYQGRERIFDTARQMANQYRWYGTGPGTFNPLFQLYRTSTDEYWPAELHNDWLETRITYGRIGMAMVLLALAIVLVRWFVPGGIHGGRRLVTLTWFALGGCLVHALFDFPFQIYSIVLLFLTLCAMLFTLSRRGN